MSIPTETRVAGQGIRPVVGLLAGLLLLCLGLPLAAAQAPGQAPGGGPPGAGAPRLMPTGPDGLLLDALARAEGLMRQGRFVEALTELDGTVLPTAAASRPNLARLHLQRGVVLMLLDRPVHARNAFNLALCFNPRVDAAVLDPSPATVRVFQEARSGLSCAGLVPPEPVAPSSPRPAAEAASASSLPTVLIVSGGVLLAAGGVLGILALDAKSEADTAADPDEAERLAGDADQYALATDICLIAGVAAAGTGLILALTRAESTPASSAPRATLLPGPGLAGLALSLTF